MSIATDHVHLGNPEDTEHRSKKTRQKSEKKQEQEQADARDGSGYATAWLHEAHPSLIHALLDCVGEEFDLGKKAWQFLPWEHAGLEAQIEARGKTYWQAFIAGVRRHWVHMKRVWIFVMYQKGIDDGRRWAAGIAPPVLADRLRQTFDETPQTLLPSSERRYDEHEGFPSPAHKLVVKLLGDAYPRVPCPDEDYLPEIEADCKEFRDFWQPFVEEPIDRVLATDAFTTSKLNDANYIAGFIDGACGKSEVLARKFSLGCK
jgi:hypothetical protein